MIVYFDTSALLPVLVEEPGSTVAARLWDEAESLYAQLDQMEIDDTLVRRAGNLAEDHGLRGYDAVHLAGAERVNGTDVVLAAGDAALLEAARSLGISVARTA